MVYHKLDFSLADLPVGGLVYCRENGLVAKVKDISEVEVNESGRMRGQVIAEYHHFGIVVRTFWRIQTVLPYPLLDR